MEHITILANACYLPKSKRTNAQLAQSLGVTEEYIFKRTGVQARYIAEQETIEDVAIQAAKKVLEKANQPKEEIGMIVVATTSAQKLMPGIAFQVQRALEISNCNCMDILAGCAGYITAFDIARNAIAVGQIQKALVIGVDKLTHYLNPEDVGTAILLADGAGATLLGASKTPKQYVSHMQADGALGDMLICQAGGNIQMQGQKVYRYAVTQTVQNVKEILEKANVEMRDIHYVLPHQSNKKIMDKIAQRLQLQEGVLYSNIETVGNVFCASIPIALSEMEDQHVLQKNQKIILLGYGGGANTASILLEI